MLLKYMKLSPGSVRGFPLVLTRCFNATVTGLKSLACQFHCHLAWSNSVPLFGHLCSCRSSKKKEKEKKKEERKLTQAESFEKQMPGKPPTLCHFPKGKN